MQIDTDWLVKLLSVGCTFNMLNIRSLIFLSRRSRQVQPPYVIFSPCTWMGIR
jgi:hypothetical protein